MNDTIAEDPNETRDSCMSKNLLEDFDANAPVDNVKFKSVFNEQDAM